MTVVPALPQLPSFTDYSLCTAPVRKIYTQDDIPSWTSSETYHLLETIILRLSVAVDGKKVEDDCVESQATKTLVDFLEKAEKWVDEIPLQTSPQRFGNKAFREWIARLQQEAPALQSALLNSEQQPVLTELSHHFLTSFGSAARLDYGTGHELSFLAYLLILRLIGVLQEQDEQAMVTRVFVAYLGVVRKLQKVFRLEPAGSKGVWGLDDHQHLVYLWGASQLRTHPTVSPSSILSPPQISPHGISYLFLSSILHVNSLKSGPFAEHSPLLHNIASTVPSWSKVSSGLLKMYRAEVLEKVPVVQHFWFGGVLGWRKATIDDDETTTGSQLVRPFKGEQLPSTGDSMAEEERAAVDELDNIRERDEGTVAPWALPQLSGRGSPNRSSPTSTAPPSRLGSTSTTPAPAPAPATATATATATAPRPFTPPTLFPSLRRKSSLSLSHLAGAEPEPEREEEGEEGKGGRGTVAEEGGAAASSSPFGVLGKASLGGGGGGSSSSSSAAGGGRTSS